MMSVTVMAMRPTAMEVRCAYEVNGTRAAWKGATRAGSKRTAWPGCHIADAAESVARIGANWSMPSFSRVKLTMKRAAWSDHAEACAARSAAPKSAVERLTKSTFIAGAGSDRRRWEPAFANAEALTMDLR